MTHEPTEPLPLYARLVRPCARCGRPVGWDGRNGFREVLPGAVAPWPTGRRRCGGWFAVTGHDPDPIKDANRSLGLGLILAAALLALALGFLWLASS